MLNIAITYTIMEYVLLQKYPRVDKVYSTQAQKRQVINYLFCFQDGDGEGYENMTEIIGEKYRQFALLSQLRPIVYIHGACSLLFDMIHRKLT